MICKLLRKKSRIEMKMRLSGWSFVRRTFLPEVFFYKITVQTPSPRASYRASRALMPAAAWTSPAHQHGAITFTATSGVTALNSVALRTVSLNILFKSAAISDLI